MTQGRIQRFDSIYLKDFFAKEIAPQVKIEVASEEAPPPPPTYSEEELNDARNLSLQAGYKQGYEEGYAKGQGEQKDREQATIEALAVITHRFETLQADYENALLREQQETTKLALSIARKLVGLHLEHHAHEHVASLVERCLPSIMNRPSLTISMHPELAASVEAQLVPMIEAKGFKGSITIVADVHLGHYDVKIAWDHGHIEHSLTRAWSDIQALVQQFSFQPDLPAQQE